MLLINSHKQFRKQFAKLTVKQRQKVRFAVRTFAETYPVAPSNLRFHSLSGEWRGSYTISVGGDLRVHFLMTQDTVTLQVVGTPAQLYE